MSTRPRHPDKDIEAALCHAEENGWRVIKSQGGQAHPWGRIFCILENRDGCRMSISSTPRSTTNHAKRILKTVSKCPH